MTATRHSLTIACRFSIGVGNRSGAQPPWWLVAERVFSDVFAMEASNEAEFSADPTVSMSRYRKACNVASAQVTCCSTLCDIFQRQFSFTIGELSSGSTGVNPAVSHSQAAEVSKRDVAFAHLLPKMLACLNLLILHTEMHIKFSGVNCLYHSVCKMLLCGIEHFNLIAESKKLSAHEVTDEWRRFCNKGITQLDSSVVVMLDLLAKDKAKDLAMYRKCLEVIVMFGAEPHLSRLRGVLAAKAVESVEASMDRNAVTDSLETEQRYYGWRRKEILRALFILSYKDQFSAKYKLVLSLSTHAVTRELFNELDSKNIATVLGTPAAASETPYAPNDGMSSRSKRSHQLRALASQVSCVGDDEMNEYENDCAGDLFVLTNLKASWIFRVNHFAEEDDSKSTETIQVTTR